MENVVMDFIANGQGTGSVASKLLGMRTMDPGMLRPFIGNDGKAYVAIYNGKGDVTDPKSYDKINVNAATLLKEEWMRLDTAVMKVAENRLNGIQDLINRGLVYDIPNALGTTVLESQEASDAMEAELTMDGVHRGKGDRQQFSTTYLPLPIIHVDYDINARVLASSRSLGNPLDTSQAERATRKVAERLEQMLFTDTKYFFGGGRIYSYVNHPDRMKATLTVGWDDSSMDGKKIVKQVIAWKQKAIDNFMYGPYVIYIPTGYETILDEDYDVSGTSTQTIRERILKISGIEDIKVVDTLPSDNVVMVQMQSDTVRLVRGMPIQNVEWNSEGGMTTHYKVMTIQVPQIRSDYNKKCGVLHIA